MSQKHSFEKLSDIQDTEVDADVHFAIQSLSPMKKVKSGVKYFDGTVTDGSRNLRIIGFDEKLQIKLSTLTENKNPVKVESCQIKQSRNDDFEILLKQSSNILPSPKKIEIPVSSLATLKVQNVSTTELNTIEDGEIVNLIATGTCVAPARPVSTGLVQEVNHCR